jgi:hypothetical protein
MDLDNATTGFVIFILLIVGANFFMYALVRGATRGGNSHWLSALKDALSKGRNARADRSLEELRKRVEELENKKNG